jgi:mycothiol system anti-sigma-R factor
MIKKTCAEVHHKMYTYLDGEISRYRRWRIQRHLRRCPPCHEGFEFEAKLKGRIRDGCKEDMPRELFDRLMSSMRDNEADG